jgi:uncharacterized protein (DUF983 family)
MPGMSIAPIIAGFRKRCPHCKTQKIFGRGKKFWTMEKFCPNCGVKFERETGEYVVSMYINIALTEALFFSGYFLSDYYFDLSVTTQLLIWAPFNALFPIWFYPRSKGLWAGVLYLMGGIYKD